MQYIFMLRAIGFVIALYAITQMMSSSFYSFEKAIIATFETVEIAAIVSQEQLTELR